MTAGEALVAGSTLTTGTAFEHLQNLGGGESSGVITGLLTPMEFSTANDMQMTETIPEDPLDTTIRMNVNKDNYDIILDIEDQEMIITEQGLEYE